MALATISIAATVHGAETADQPDQQATINALKARVAELERRMSGGPNEAALAERRAQEVRELVYDVLADADTRASLLDNGAFDRGGGIFKLEDAYIQRAIGDTRWNIKVGQCKSPFQREEPQIRPATTKADTALAHPGGRRMGAAQRRDAPPGAWLDCDTNTTRPSAFALRPTYAAASPGSTRPRAYRFVCGESAPI